MFNNLKEVIKNKTYILNTLFAFLALIVAMNYDISTNYIVSVLFSAISWLVLTILVVFIKFPHKVLAKPDKFKLALAFLFDLCFTVLYVMTNRVPITELNLLYPVLAFVCGFWFYYSVLPDITPNFKKRLVFSFLAIAALTVIVLIYVPFESYIQNIESFEFDCWNFSDYYLYVFVTATVFFALLLNTLKAKYYWVVYKLIIAFDICIFAQYSFMNKHLSLLGVANDNSSSMFITITNLLVWIVIFVAVFMAPKLLKDKWPKVYRALSAVILVYHIVAFAIVCIMAPSNAFTTTIEYYTDTSGQFTLSSNENVIVVVFDAFDNKYVNDLVDSNPEYFDGLEDFTVFTNTTSVYDSTVTSMNQMFGGCEFDNTKTLEQWLDSGWNSDSTVEFYAQMHEKGYECNAYNFELPLKEYAYGKIDNFKKYDAPQEVRPAYFNINKFVDDINLLTAYRVMPYIVKNLITFEADAFKYYSTYPMSDLASFSNSQYIESMNYEYVDTNIMNVNHISGLHSPCIVSDEIDNCFLIMKNIVAELKAKGCYDNSTIIFMSDHGWHNEDASTDGWGATPMLFVKPLGASNEDTVFSSAPVSTTDIMGTIADCVDLNDASSIGSSVYDYDESSVRTRYFYDRVRAPELPDVYSAGKLSYIVKYNAFAKYEIEGDSDIMYGVDPFANGNDIVPMREYFG